MIEEYARMMTNELMFCFKSHEYTGLKAENDQILAQCLIRGLEQDANRKLNKVLKMQEA